MKKALIIANMLFASATVWGMIPHDQNDNFGNKGKFSRIEESSGENRQPEKKSRHLREASNSIDIEQRKLISVWDVRDSKISRPSNISDESLLPFRRSVLSLKPYVTTSASRNFQLTSLTRAYAQTMKATDIGVLKLGGKFPNLRELSINASDLLSISLKNLSFPKLKEIEILGEVDRENRLVVERLNQLILKTSSTLQKLNLSNTQIGVLPESIGNCENLIHLDLNESGIENLPESIQNCKKLQYLDISNNFMSVIPDVVFGLDKLKHLDFQQTSDVYEIMKDLSPKISNLANLEYLAITGDSALTTLPPQIEHLKNLKTLILEANGLESLPKEIGDLENLNYLDLSACELKTLPAEIGKLRNLETLNIENNEEIKSIPPEILNLFENRLKATDKESCNLTLRYLLAYKNKTAMNNDDLKKFTEQNQKEEEMLRERRNNLKSSLNGLRLYVDVDVDDESVSSSESDSESAESISDSSEE